MTSLHPDIAATEHRRDSSPPSPRLEPASCHNPELAANPRLLSRLFHSAILPSERGIHIYLPQAYLAELDRRFPVFYLHDGQNLFDGETAYHPGHTWRAHTTADTLAAAGEIEPVILVGIDNAGPRRIAEYTPTCDDRLGGGDGGSYARLLIHELKPLLDQELRTLPGREHTAVGGSSLGGLISLYLGLEHRDIFGKIAVLSPSLWWDHRKMLRLVRNASPSPELRIWLDVGTGEGAQHLHNTDQLFTLLLERGWRSDRDLAYLRAEGEPHVEDAWAARFPQVLSFLFPALPYRSPDL